MDLRFQGRPISHQPKQTVLEALLAADEVIDNSCRSGSCQSCLLLCTEGNLPPGAQVGLRPAARKRGLFLSCLAKPTDASGGISIERADSVPAFTLELVEREALTPSIFRLRFKAPTRPEFDGGQFLTLLHPEGVKRSYSIASLPTEELIELQIRKIPDGVMSGYLAEQLEIGDQVAAEGPRGDCTYSDDDPDQALVLVGAGTGMAPLWAVLKSALAANHRGPIQVVQVALSPERLYLLDDLRALASQHDIVSVSSCVAKDPEGIADQNCRVGDVFEVLRELVPEPKGQRIYLCGDPSLVLKLRREFFLSGAALDDIFGDPFSAAAT